MKGRHRAQKGNDIIFPGHYRIFERAHLKCNVLPLMICRFSNMDRDVRFSGQNWITRYPGGHAHSDISNLHKVSRCEKHSDL